MSEQRRGEVYAIAAVKNLVDQLSLMRTSVVQEMHDKPFLEVMAVLETRTLDLTRAAVSSAFVMGYHAGKEDGALGRFVHARRTKEGD